jgi:RHS repeat-associated protein
VLQRSEYEPYGQLTNRALTDGPGYTGHVQDAATGLTYMEQRYQDPLLGRMLSVDPVDALSDPARNFNRYAYAWGNPYRFYDPDGRYPVGGFGMLQLFQSIGNVSQPIANQEPPEPTNLDGITVHGTTIDPEPIAAPPTTLMLGGAETGPTTPSMKVPPIHFANKGFRAYFGACWDYLAIPWEAAVPASLSERATKVANKMGLRGAGWVGKRVTGPIALVTGTYETGVAMVCGMAGIQTLQ